MQLCVCKISFVKREAKNSRASKKIFSFSHIYNICVYDKYLKQCLYSYSRTKTHVSLIQQKNAYTNILNILKRDKKEG